MTQARNLNDASLRYAGIHLYALAGHFQGDHSTKTSLRIRSVNRIGIVPNNTTYLVKYGTV
jgi:hypothetical protein